MEKIILNQKQISVLQQKLKIYGINEIFIKEALSLTEISQLEVESNAKDYDSARSEWGNASVGSQKEKAALRKRVEFAINENDPHNLLDPYDLLIDCFDDVAGEDEEDEKLVIRALAQLIINEEK